MNSEGTVAEPLVVAFADAGYLPLLRLWVRRVRALGVSRLRIYALDAATLDWCRSQDVEVAALAWSGRLADLWVQRIGVFSELLAGGQGFIHSDIDAIWLRHPLREGAAVGCTEDLVFTQGTVWPPDVHRQWGFVLCCGWFWAKPTPAAQRFFAALEGDVRYTGDDQISVNRVLAGAGAHWEAGPHGDYQLPFRDQQVQCWTKTIRARTAAPGFSPALSIALLPHREFQRLPEPWGPAIVKHLLTPKNCAQKLELLGSMGLL